MTRPAEKMKGYRDRMAAVLDRFRENLDRIGTFVKGIQTRTRTPGRSP
ncbi:hypothetical protein [Streptomyces lancefieldiae]|uniref:Uncharacterized protein n=1 Tax=Streptomyces lancefieldiae TaxID=3075520 RepID=A0ABU3AHQ7_9ACTN|nr:hypothetical protein [Streptomyces sp. DSM 40712]MDT0609062.1 hypothetical protein [Streptomyces sp. DSM 40712]